MDDIREIPFVVVDVETNGSNCISERITDIALVTVIDNEIVNEYSSLINPHQFIPPFISKMTGISNELAASAPESREIIPQVHEILNTPNAIFVAHNAGFDWSFVKAALEREWINVPNMKQLCTLKLSRRLVDKNIRKNLGDLSKYFNINITNRHRALGDAKATALLLIEMLEIAKKHYNINSISELLKLQNKQIRSFKTAPESKDIVETKLSELPESSGVYYFKDKTDRIIYVGKAKSLKNRVRTYFHNNSHSSHKIAKLIKRIHSIEWVEKDSELEALIFEAKEIRRLMPEFNSQGKRDKHYSFVKITNHEFPKVELSNDTLDKDADYFGPIRFSRLVEEISRILHKNFKIRLCEDNRLISQKGKPCLYYHIDRCSAPCAGLIEPKDYAKEIEKVKHYLGSFSTGLIKDLETEMFHHSDELDFESAAFVRDKISEIVRLIDLQTESPSTIKNFNLVSLVPSSKREKLIDVYLIRHGKLLKQITIGRKANLDNLLSSVSEIFFNGTITHDIMDNVDVNEMRIISSWLFRRSSISKNLYLNHSNFNEFSNRLQNSFKTFDF